MSNAFKNVPVSKLASSAWVRTGPAGEFSSALKALDAVKDQKTKHALEDRVMELGKLKLPTHSSESAGSLAVIDVPPKAWGGNAPNFGRFAEYEHEEAHGYKTGRVWDRILLYLGFPAIGAAILNANNLAAEHEHHIEHLKELNGGELQRVLYPYMAIRHKEFPWGMNSFFYNPETQIDATQENNTV